MKIALINDVHFGARSDHEGIARFQEKFYRDVFFPHLEANEIKDVFILGDVFDRRKYVNFKTLYHARRMFFDPALQRGLNVWALTGNHDVAYKNTNEINSPTLLLTGYSNVKVWPKFPDVHQFGSLHVGIVPWICEENVDQINEFLAKTSVKVIFGHFDINGFEMMPGVTCTNGLDPSLFSRFDMVITGHYHHKSSMGNIHYLGCQYEMDWGDYGDQKGFHVFDTEKVELEFIRNPNRMFLKVPYEDKVTKHPPQDLGGKFIKLIVRKREDTYSFDKFVDEIIAQHPEDVQIIDQDITVVEENVESDDGIAAKSTVQILREYVNKIEGIPPKIKVSVESMLQDLYNEAQASK